MPPRKNKNKKNDQDEELDKVGKNSKWMDILNNEEDDQQANAEELYQKPKKQIFNFDFSKEHLLLNQKEPVKKQEPKIQLTPQEQQELDRRLQKQRKEKQQKEKIRKEKKLERKKILQKQKQEQKLKKEVQQQQEQQLEKVLESNKNKSGDTKIIFYTILTLGILMGLLQYQKDIYVKLSKFKLDGEVNYYQVLQTSNGVSQGQLKAQYKKLVLKYHPDKNPNCHTCKQKFQSIMQAWEVLGNLQKRDHYDKNSGFINQISSLSLTLNAQNYQYLLGDSDEIWVVQVYDSTNQYSHYFANLWDDVVANYKGIVNFGRIDVWQQSDMKSYIPYKFQLFPGIYTVQRGYQKLCQFSYERPTKSIQFCIEQRAQETQFTKINDWSQIKEKANKKSVIIGGGIKLGTRIKIINSKLQRYFDYYVMNNAQNTIRIKGTEHKFDFISDNTKKIYQKYQHFLLSNTIQLKSMCQVHINCKEIPCILILDKNAIIDKLQQHPIIQIKEQEEFNHKIEVIKNTTGLYQKFEIGFYQDGKLQLGNFDQIEDLNPQIGEVINLPCIASTWIRTIMKLAQNLIE